MNAFQILGVQEGESIEVCKKAYRKLVLIHHPDRGGDIEKFQAIQKAYKEVQEYKPSMKVTHLSIFEFK